MQCIPSIGRGEYFWLSLLHKYGQAALSSRAREHRLEYDDEFRRTTQDAYERELDRMERAGRPLTKSGSVIPLRRARRVLLGNYGLAERMLSTYRGKRPRHWVSDWLARPAPENVTVAGLRTVLADIKLKK